MRDQEHDDPIVVAVGHNHPAFVVSELSDEDWAEIRRLSEQIKAGGVVDLEPAEDVYLVWSNEHRAWWGANHRGYFGGIEYAGRYTKAEAIDIAKGANAFSPKHEAPNEIAISERDALASLGAGA